MNIEDKTAITDTPRRRTPVLRHDGPPLGERAYGAAACILHDGCPDRMRCFLAGHCLDIAPTIWPPDGDGA